MSIEIRPARPDDRDLVCNLLHQKMSRRIAPERWRRIVDGRWSNWRRDFGVIAEEDGALVGFLGIVYAERPIANGTRRSGNLTSWYITKPYRGRGIGWRMLRAAISDPTVTYTTFSSNPPALRLMEKAGLEQLDAQRMIWEPSTQDNPDISVITDPTEIQPRLSERSARVLEDHTSLNVLPHLVRTNGVSSYLVLLHIKMKGPDIAYHEVLYVEDPVAFSRHARSFAAIVLRSDEAVLSVDARFCTGDADPDRTEWIEAPRFYRPVGMEAVDVDFLYSEIVLLDLKL